MKHAPHQNGNAFFIILLGVALFAAFTLAVTRSSQQGGSGNPEMDKLAATNIVKYGTTVKEATDQLRQQGISESDISFANSTISGYGTVGANPAGEVFNISGGGITYEPPSAKWLDSTYNLQDGYGEWRFIGSMHVRNVGTPATATCAAAGCAELIAVLPFVKGDVCRALNKQLGISAIGTVPSANFDTSIAFTKFTGGYAATDQLGDNPTTGLFNGRQAGCLQGSGTPASGSYFYYQVLLAR